MIVDRKLDAAKGNEQLTIVPGTPLDFLADEGSIFTCVNSIPGTGLNQGVISGFSSTAALLTLRNNGAAGKRIYPKWLRLIPTVVPASATRSEFLISIDSITRYSSGGTAVTVLKNVNMDSAAASDAIVHFGQLTLAAASGNERRIARGQLRSAIPVVGEEIVLTFDGFHAPGTLGGTTAIESVAGVAPIIIGAGHSMQIHVWHPGNATTGASWEFELCWAER